MSTRRVTLTTDWQLLGRGPGLIQVATQGVAYVAVHSSPPASNDTGHHLIDHKNKSFSYYGSLNMYAKAKGNAVDVVVTATVFE